MEPAPALGFLEIVGCDRAVRTVSVPIGNTTEGASHLPRCIVVSSFVGDCRFRSDTLSGCKAGSLVEVRESSSREENARSGMSRSTGTGAIRAPAQLSLPLARARLSVASVMIGIFSFGIKISYGRMRADRQCFL